MNKRDDEDRGREPRSGGAAGGRSTGRGGPAGARGGAGAGRGGAGAGRSGAGAGRGGAGTGRGGAGAGRGGGAGERTGGRSGGYGRDARGGSGAGGRDERGGGYGSGPGERSSGRSGGSGERTGGYGRDAGAGRGGAGAGGYAGGNRDGGARSGGSGREGGGERSGGWGASSGRGGAGGARSGGRPTGGAGRPGGAGAGRPGAGGSGRPGGGGGGGASRSGPGTGRSGASAGRSVRPGAAWNTRGANEASPDAGRGRRDKGGPTRDVHEPGGIRLQKVLASAGLGSRRACEVLIEEGRVSVDGVVVRELGVRVEPSTAVIHVDGLRVQLDSSVLTLALHKPAGVVSTMSDPQGRPTLEQYVADRTERLFHVGRLDEQTEGLLLLTNDGELAHRLAHPSYEVVKTYVATIEGRVAPGLSKILRTGVELEDGPASVDKFTVLETAPNASVVEVELHEGRTHIVRRLFEEVGHPVIRLVRTRFGPIRLGALKPGKTRVIGGPELGSLMSAVDL
ncbi:pseudouridine synthase [Georgenia sp. MJ206]|uniref:pseudouridine synthase n=1 Tax=Georgenia wangjunii TaxID=3117730 RepID=UPI002F26C09D